MNNFPPDPMQSLNRDKLEAERQKLIAERNKLVADRKVAASQLTPSYRRREDLKAWAGVGGIASGLAAAAALLISSNQWAAQQKAQQSIDAGQRFQEGLVLSSDSLKSKRLSGVTLLSSIVKSSPDYRERALLGLSNALILEESPAVRGAIVETFKSAGPDIVSKDILDNVLASLIEKSRILVSDGSLYGTVRPTGEVVPRNSTSRATFFAKAISVARSIMALIRNGASSRDYSDIYCADCTFPPTSSYDNAKFNRAILTGAVFDGASLRKASFVDADTLGASFQRSDLNGADFDTSRYWLYRLDGASLPGRIRDGQLRSTFVTRTHFECADLRGASFAGYPVATYVFRKTKVERAVYARFHGADLTGAKLARMRIILIVPAKADDGRFDNGGGRSLLSHEDRTFDRRTDVEVMQIASMDLLSLMLDPSELAAVGRNLTLPFRNSRWSNAELDPEFKKALTAAHTSEEAPTFCLSGVGSTPAPSARTNPAYSTP